MVPTGTARSSVGKQMNGGRLPEAAGTRQVLHRLELSGWSIGSLLLWLLLGMSDAAEHMPEYSLLSSHAC
jgi:hypothetical protein